MRPVSAALLRTVASSHAMSARARVCTTFQTGTDPTGTEIPIFAGDVVSDATAQIRSTLEMSTDGTGMWPRYADDLLAPYGNEIFVERGVAYGSGTIEWVSLGYYRIQSPVQDEPPGPPDGPIRISAKDRMAGIVDARLTAPAQFTAAQTYGTVVSTLVTQVYPSATVQWDDATDDDTLGRSVIVEEDRYGFLDDLVKSKGKIWYWDHRGILVIKDPPAVDTPVFDVLAGAGGVLVSLSRQLTRDRVYNIVVASGLAGDTVDPVRAVAVDHNPRSPTYHLGPFGPVPQFYSSPLLTSAAQAQLAARTILLRGLGLPYNVDFTAVPNPALEPWDPVRVRSSVRDSTEIHVLQRVSVPLVAGAPMMAETRERTVVLVGMA